MSIPPVPPGADRRVHVLLIEDHEDSREMVQLALEAAGVIVTCARNGAEGLACLRAGPLPDVILCDLRMPVMDGWQFCQAVSADVAFARVPVIIVSADPVLGDGRPAPGDVRIPKPVDIEKLLVTVKRLVP